MIARDLLKMLVVAPSNQRTLIMFHSLWCFRSQVIVVVNLSIFSLDHVCVCRWKLLHLQFFLYFFVYHYGPVCELFYPIMALGTNCDILCFMVIKLLEPLQGNAYFQCNISNSGMLLSLQEIYGAGMVGLTQSYHRDPPYTIETIQLDFMGLEPSFWALCRFLSATNSIGQLIYLLYNSTSVLATVHLTAYVISCCPTLEREWDFKLSSELRCQNIKKSVLTFSSTITATIIDSL